MPLSTLDSKIVNYLPLLGASEKKSILEVIKSFLQLKDQSLLKEDAISIDQYNKELQDALESVRNGNFTSHEQLEKEMETW